MALTSRWTKLRPHKIQKAYWESLCRFNVVPAGRRSGKTELAKRKIVKRALKGTEFDDARFFIGAPVRDQVRRIYWEDLKAMIPRDLLAAPPSESRLEFKLINGSEIHLLGMDRPERIEGIPWDGGVLDEYGNMKERTWPEHVRPALSDRTGWCDFIGVPEGRNHYWDLAEFAMSSEDPNWRFFTWPSSDILPPDEIMAAKRELDEITYMQEYEASFVYFQGRAYYAFDSTIHAKYDLFYEPDGNLFICFDFNIAPGVAAILQQHKKEWYENLPDNVSDDFIAVISEVHIPRESNTAKICSEIIKDFGDHKGHVYVYGDSTGGASGTAKLLGSDWDLIQMILGKHFGDKFHLRVPRSNPRERDRVNCVNSCFRSYLGIIKMLVDKDNCPMIIKDFEGTMVVDGDGEIDKKTNKEITHISDAIGYFCSYEHPIISDFGNVIKAVGI